MKIAIVGSMTFVDKMLETKKNLENNNHKVFASSFAEEYSKLPKEQIESQTIKDKNNKDGLIEFCNLIEKCDAVLALNYDKKGIKNYIGGNSFLELGYGFILGKKIYFLKPIPEMIYTSELEAMKPVILLGDLTKLQ
ncbi:MAG: hypothetical protein WCO33_00220 [bacterium]